MRTKPIIYDGTDANLDRAMSQEIRAASCLQETSMSLHREQKTYYQALNIAQRGNGDITGWLEWFCKAFEVLAARAS